MFKPDGEGAQATALLRLRPAGPAEIVPAWVLPLMRLRRSLPGAPLSAAWRRLPLALPAGVAMPGEEEAAIVLLNLGLA